MSDLAEVLAVGVGWLLAEDARFDVLFDDSLGHDHPDGVELDAHYAVADMVAAARNAALIVAPWMVPLLPTRAIEIAGPPFDPTAPCQMFCTEPIGPDGTMWTYETKASCPECEHKLYVLTHDVLPSIRKHGYAAPPGAPMEVELDAMVRDQGKRERFHSIMSDLFGQGVADTMFNPGETT